MTNAELQILLKQYPDDWKIIAFGPDSGGYDVIWGTDVHIVHDLRTPKCIYVKHGEGEIDI